MPLRFCGVVFCSVILWEFICCCARVQEERKKDLETGQSCFIAAKNLFQGLGDTDKNALRNRGIIFGNWGKIRPFS